MFGEVPQVVLQSALIRSVKKKKKKKKIKRGVFFVCVSRGAYRCGGGFVQASALVSQLRGEMSRFPS